ncbi:MAG TPA: hypothetical protein VEG31_01385, partial [Thermoproteota archaeon]|nr:hypothetical protein [Thermoproteota archaeon]
MTFGVSSSIGWLAEKLTKRTMSDRELSSLLDEFKFDLAKNDVSWELAEQLAANMREELEARKVERFGADIRQLLLNTFKTYLTAALPDQEVDLLDMAKVKSGETFVLMFIGA